MRKILITTNNNVDCEGISYGMPWKHDSCCYNFNMPDEHINVDSINEIENVDNIGTLVIGSPLNNYDFISRMTNIEQIYIYDAGFLKDLSFLKGLCKLNQLCILADKIGSISALLELLEKKERIIAENKTLHNIILYGLDCICLNTASYIPIEGFQLNTRYTTEIIINKKHLKK